MSVLLPAPFSPHSAWTSPFSRSKETRSSARTPGNSLLIPRSSSSAIDPCLYPQGRTDALRVAPTPGPPPSSARDGLAVIGEPGRRSDREGAVAARRGRESLGAPSLRPPPGGGPAARARTRTEVSL